MKAKYFHFFFLLNFGTLFFSPFSFNAQKAINLSIEDGLPSNSIRCLFRASNGLLWIGTDAGLCSYDGKNIKVFDENNGLPSNMVWALTEDRKGHLWIGCYNGGISYYNGTTFKNYSKKDGLPSNKVRKLSFKNDLLFISTDDKLVIFDGDKFYFKNFMMQVMSIVEVDTTMLVISQATGIFKLTYFKDNLADFMLDSCGWYGSSFGGVSYMDCLLLFKSNKLMKFSKNSIKYCLNPEIIKSNSVTWEASVVNDSSVYLAQWGVTVNSGGLFKYDGEEIKSVNNKFGIDSKQILSLLHDKSNNILWVGTLDMGMYILFLNEW